MTDENTNNPPCEHDWVLDSTEVTARDYHPVSKSHVEADWESRKYTCRKCGEKGEDLVRVEWHD